MISRSNRQLALLWSNFSMADRRLFFTVDVVSGLDGGFVLGKMLGTAVFTRTLGCCTGNPHSAIIRGPGSKQLSSKCAEHSSDDCVGPSHCALVLRTCEVHSCLLEGSWGNFNKLNPSCRLLVQLAATHGVPMTNTSCSSGVNSRADVYIHLTTMAWFPPAP
jgi:hypothetical protein